MVLRCRYIDRHGYSAARPTSPHRGSSAFRAQPTIEAFRGKQLKRAILPLKIDRADFGNHQSRNLPHDLIEPLLPIPGSAMISRRRRAMTRSAVCSACPGPCGSSDLLVTICRPPSVSTSVKNGDAMHHPLAILSKRSHRAGFEPDRPSHRAVASPPTGITASAIHCPAHRPYAACAPQVRHKPHRSEH